MAGPDIKAPRLNLPEWAWWAIGGGVAFSVILGALYYKKTHQPVEQTPITVSSELPDDFFPSKEAPKPEPKPEETDAEKEAKRKAAAAAAAAAPPAVKVTARDLFQEAPKPPPAPPQPSAAEIWNAQRRGAAVSKVSMAGHTSSDTRYVATEKEWDEPQTEASFPIDMSRIVTVDRFISAILVNAINSELPGKVVAQIEENILGAHGSFILIPAGSKAVGRYKPLQKPGDERITVVWERIITPAGINIHVGDAEMSDAMGRSGITGDVDNRYMERYGMALLVSTLSAITSYNVPVTSTGQAIVIQQYGSGLANLSSQILEKNINLRPRVEIPAGQRILISPTKDIWFKKPEPQSMTMLALDASMSKITSKTNQGVRK